MASTGLKQVLIGVKGTGAWTGGTKGRGNINCIGTVCLVGQTQVWMDCLAAIGVSALAGRVFPAEVPGRRVRSQKGASWQARRCWEHRGCRHSEQLRCAARLLLGCLSATGSVWCLRSRGAGCPCWRASGLGGPGVLLLLLPRLPTACGETRVCGLQAGSSALLTGTGDEAETTTAGCEKLEPFGLGRWAVSCRLQRLFAPALPPGTRLPPPNRPAAGRRQAWKLILHLNDCSLITFSLIAAALSKSKSRNLVLPVWGLLNGQAGETRLNEKLAGVALGRVL